MSAGEASRAAVEFAVHADAGDRCATVVGVVLGGEFRAYVDEDGELVGDRAQPAEAAPGTELIEGPASALPLRIAEFVDLGPRPAPDADASVLIAEELGGEGRDGVLATWDAEQRDGTALEGDDWLWWTAAVSWEVDGEPRVNVLSVIDGGAQGLAVVLEHERGGLVATPCTSTEVWAALCDLLPRASDLA